MPNRSSLPRADSRHSWRTSQVRQTFLASRVEPPFSGKNASGSVWAHRPRSCHPPSSWPSPSRRYSSLATDCSSMVFTCLPLFDPSILTDRVANHTGVITCLSYALRQAELWYWDRLVHTVVHV